MWDSLSRRGSLIAAAALLGVAYGVAVLAAVLAQPLAFAAAVAVATLLDVLIERRFGALAALLRRIQFGISHRAFVQIFLLVLLIAVTEVDRNASRVQVLTATLTALAVPVARMAYLGLLTLARRRAVPPIEVRNLELPERLRPPPMPAVLTDDAPRRLLVLGVLPVLAGALSVWSGQFWPFYAVSGSYVTVALLPGSWLALRLFRRSGGPGAQEYVDTVSRLLQRRHPEVVLYHGGPANAMYQVNMWLATLERMRRPCVILLRDRRAIRDLERTDVPAVCIPRSVDLMNFALPDARIALYVANTGNNIHLLREPGIKHVFIGHGDSDKVGSFNPFSKVYDQIWVAGQAGRERYARAGVGVRDEAIVEVGRPQVDGLSRRAERAPSAASEPLTVLYLPTWEGWTDDDFQTSLTDMGQHLISRLLASPLPVRVVYRPHPLTGIRDPRARASDARIRSAVEAAAGRQGPVDHDDSTRLDALAARARENGLTPAEGRRLTAEWNAGFWVANAGRHLVVEGRLPSLFDCFDAADLLVADVSSVVTDFLATGKPLVVANPRGLSEEEFREQYPSASAAYLLHPGPTEIDDVLAAVTGGDPMAASRQRARTHLLGPDEPLAIARWDQAVERLIAAAEVECPTPYGAGPGLPLQPSRSV